MPNERQIVVNPLAPSSATQGSRRGDILASAFPASPIPASSTTLAGQMSDEDVRTFYLDNVMRATAGTGGYYFSSYTMSYVESSTSAPVQTKALNPDGAPNGVVVATTLNTQGMPSSAKASDGSIWPRPTPVSSPSGVRNVVGASYINQITIVSDDVNIGQTSTGYGSGPASPQQPSDTSNNDIANQFITDWLSPPESPPADSSSGETSES
tara:strand:- start:5598 stop:6230 length:633 start_codon:yes stop_codon:yes gene_type:complete